MTRKVSNPVPVPAFYCASYAAIDLMSLAYKEWLAAMTLGYYRFWLKPVLPQKPGKPPKGYYFKLARLPPR